MFRSNVDDIIGGVEERSSQNNRGLFFFYSHVQDHEIGRNIAILNLYNDILCYSLRKPNSLVAICNCIYIGYKGSLPNKYSYVIFDIILTPNPILQKVLWKTFWLIRHSIVGTLGSSFFARNGGVNKPSYSNWTVLIILTVSSCVWLALFFLQLLGFFFSLIVTGSFLLDGAWGCAGVCSIWFLNENFSLLSLIVKTILECYA
jgi:hypothetical protein